MAAKTDENDELALELVKDYGESQPQDLHIEHFYLILRNKYTIGRTEEVIAKLQAIGFKWNILHKSEWPGFIWGKFPKLSSSETEREREERLNSDIRMKLLMMLAQETENTPEIIIGRVCKYTKEAVARESLTTTDIEQVFKTPNDQHLDYFYLVVKFMHIPGEFKINIIEEVENLPGEWKAIKSPKAADTRQEPRRSPSVTSEERYIFIGYFPKKGFESERQREQRLNIEVRDKLRASLVFKLYGEFPENSEEKRVLVLFARACKYSKM